MQETGHAVLHIGPSFFVGLSYPILSDSGNDRQSATLGLCPTQSIRIRAIVDSQPKTLDF